MSARKGTHERPRVTADAMNAATRVLAPSTLDGAPAFIGMCDQTFRPIYLNPAGRSMVGFPDTLDLTSVAVSDFFIREHRPVIDTVGLPTMAREGRWEQDLRFRHWIDATHELQVACCIFGLYDDRKNFLAGVTITQEIKSRSKADKAIRESRAMVDAVLEQLPVEVGIFDAAGRLLHSNDGWRRHGMYSLPPRTRTSPQRWKRFAKGDAILATEDHGSQALQGHPFRGEERLPTGPGQPHHWYRVNASPLGENAEAPQGAIVVLQDIDDLKGASARLAHSEARLKVAADITGVGTFLFDPTTGTFECDARLRQLWGIRTGESMDWESFQGAIHPEDAARVRAGIGSCMSAARPQTMQLEFRITCRDSGKIRRIGSSCRSTFDGPSMTALAGACLDITPACHASVPASSRRA